MSEYSEPMLRSTEETNDNTEIEEEPIDLNSMEEVSEFYEFIKSMKYVEIRKYLVKFPFEELEEVDLLNFQLVRLLKKIIMNTYKMLKPQHLIQSMMFFQRIIRNCLHNPQEDLTHIKFALTDLLLCLEWIVHRYNKRIACNNLIETLHNVIVHPNMRHDIKHVAILTFIQIVARLDSAEINEDFNQYGAAILQATSSVQHKVHICNELLCLTDSDKLPIVNEVYKIIISLTGIIQQEYSRFTMIHYTNCLRQIFEFCDDEKVILELAIELAKNQFPHALLAYFNDTEVCHVIKRLYEKQLMAIFKNSPWRSQQASLSQIIYNFSSTCNLIDERDADFQYVVYYMEFMYRGKVHENAEALANEIRYKFEKNVPYKNPALFKSIILLYAAYIPKNAKLNEFYNFLLTMQHMDNLEDCLTYHISVLTWVITFGSRPLKYRVLTLFLKYYPNRNHIITFLKQTENQGVLVDVIQLNNDEELQYLALGVLEKATTSEKCFILVLQVFLNTEISSKMIEMIIRSNIINDCTLPKAGSLNKDELTTVYLVIDLFVRSLCDENHPLSEDFIAMTVTFLHRICNCVKHNLPALRVFVVADLIERMVIWAQHDNEQLVLPVLNFLILIVEVQHHHMGVTKQVEFQSCKFRFSEPVVQAALTLIKGIIRQPSDVNKVLIMHRPYLQVYSNLLDALTSKYGKDVVGLLIYLMDTERECVASFMNVVCITMHCRQLTVDDNFITYLDHWCKKAYARANYIVPVKYISRFIKHLITIEYNNVDYSKIRNLLFNSGELKIN